MTSILYRGTPMPNTFYPLSLYAFVGVVRTKAYDVDLAGYEIMLYLQSLYPSFVEGNEQYSFTNITAENWDGLNF